MSSDSSVQRLSLWIIAASLTVVVAYYGLPEIVHRVTLAVERGRADAADVQLKKLGDSSEVFRLVAKRVAPAVVNVSNLALVSRNRRLETRTNSTSTSTVMRILQ